MERNWDYPITITSWYFCHCGQCQPERQNRIAAIKRCGMLLALFQRISCSCYLIYWRWWNVELPAKMDKKWYLQCLSRKNETASIIPQFKWFLWRLHTCDKWARVFGWYWEQSVFRIDDIVLKFGTSVVDGCDIVSWPKNFCPSSTTWNITLIKQHAMGFVYENGSDSNEKIVDVVWMVSTMRKTLSLLDHMSVFSSWSMLSIHSFVVLCFCCNVKQTSLDLHWLWSNFIWREEANIGVIVWLLQK